MDRDHGQRRKHGLLPPVKGETASGLAAAYTHEAKLGRNVPADLGRYLSRINPHYIPAINMLGRLFSGRAISGLQETAEDEQEVTIEQIFLLGNRYGAIFGYCATERAAEEAENCGDYIQPAKPASQEPEKKRDQGVIEDLVMGDDIASKILRTHVPCMKEAGDGYLELLRTTNSSADPSFERVMVELLDEKGVPKEQIMNYVGVAHLVRDVLEEVVKYKGSSSKGSVTTKEKRSETMKEKKIHEAQEEIRGREMLRRLQARLKSSQNLVGLMEDGLSPTSERDNSPNERRIEELEQIYFPETGSNESLKVSPPWESSN